jgi:hypothetical protein
MTTQSSWPHRERRQFPSLRPKPVIRKLPGVPQWTCQLSGWGARPLMVGHGMTPELAFRSWARKMAEQISL